MIETKDVATSAPIPRGAVYHEDLADLWASKYKSGGFARRIRRFYELLKGNVSTGTIWLDAGSGSGLLSNEIASLGARVVSVDASPRMIKSAKEANFPGKERIDFQVIESIESLPFDDDAFDGCVCSSVIEYVDCPSHALAEISRILKVKSPFIISIPNKFSLIRFAQKIIRRSLLFFNVSKYDYLEFSVNSYGIDEFKVELEQTGFRVIAISYFDPVMCNIKIIESLSSLIIYYAVKDN